MFTAGVDIYIYVIVAIMALGALVAAPVPALAREAVPKCNMVFFSIQEPKEKEKKPFWKRKRDTTREVRDKLDKFRSESDGNLPIETAPVSKKTSPDKETTDSDTAPKGLESSGNDLPGNLTTDTVKSDDSDDYFDDDFEEETKSKNSSSEKSGDTDSLFDLFATEIVEENKAGQLAASLDDIDIRDILSEAQQILNELRSISPSNRRQPPSF